MTLDSISTREMLYEARINLTNVIEFGASMDALVSQQSALPPEGARFDVAFDGTVSGSRLAGTVAGVDYLYVRADRRLQLHIHGVIATNDGTNISFFADGVAMPGAQGHLLELRENVMLTTSSEAYSWVNPLQIWGRGTVDLQAMEIRVRAHIA